MCTRASPSIARTPGPRRSARLGHRPSNRPSSVIAAPRSAIRTQQHGLVSPRAYARARRRCRRVYVGLQLWPYCHRTAYLCGSLPGPGWRAYGARYSRHVPLDPGHCCAREQLRVRIHSRFRVCFGRGGGRCGCGGTVRTSGFLCDVGLFLKNGVTGCVKTSRTLIYKHLAALPAARCATTSNLQPPLRRLKLFRSCSNSPLARAVCGIHRPLRGR